jgi:hypothetical protein
VIWWHQCWSIKTCITFSFDNWIYSNHETKRRFWRKQKIKNQCRREIWRTLIINTISHVDKIKCDCAIRHSRIDRNRISWKKIEFVRSRLEVSMRMHYWFKSLNLSIRLMSLFFERRFKKRRQHEFCNFEWWTFVSHEIQCCRIEFFYDFKIRHEFEDYCEMTTRIWWIHNEFSKSDRSCSFKDEITHQTITFICSARRLRFLASNAVIYNS